MFWLSCVECWCLPGLVFIYSAAQRWRHFSGATPGQWRELVVRQHNWFCVSTLLHWCWDVMMVMMSGAECELVCRDDDEWCFSGTKIRVDWPDSTSQHTETHLYWLITSYSINKDQQTKYQLLNGWWSFDCDCAFQWSWASLCFLYKFMNHVSTLIHHVYSPM